MWSDDENACLLEDHQPHHSPANSFVTRSNVASESPSAGDPFVLSHAQSSPSAADPFVLSHAQSSPSAVDPFVLSHAQSSPSGVNPFLTHSPSVPAAVVNNPFMAAPAPVVPVAHSHRKTKEPDRFDGSKPWREYESHFRACWQLNAWTDKEAAAYLAASLRDSACKVLQPVPVDYYTGRRRAHTIEELLQRLEKRYGPGKLADSFLLQLKGRRRRPKETLRELGEAVSELVDQAYPEAPPHMRERLAKDQFKEAVDDGEMRYAIHRAHCQTLDDAVEAALEAESFIAMEGRRKRSAVHQVSQSVPMTTPAPEPELPQEQPPWTQAQPVQCCQCGHESHERSQAPQQGPPNQQPPWIRRAPRPPMVQSYQYGHEGYERSQAPQRGPPSQQPPWIRRAPRSSMVQCYQCGQDGHIRPNCPQRRCHVCGKEGHVGRRCPQRGPCFLCGNYGHLQPECNETQMQGNLPQPNQEPGRRL
ncbi:uncharacterized protein [Amphiura filiformis]|uniref:uncharacterized protein n=1 Tax=Amphiura filiformis TaxID=82378 RepID=UPI003B227A49